MSLAPAIHPVPLEVTIRDRHATFNPIAVETPQGVVLVDTGFADTTDVLWEALADAGLSKADVWAVVITHQDPDHAGGLAAVVDQTNAAVIAHEAATPYLEGDRELVKSTAERSIQIPSATVDIQFVGGETIATRAGPMRAIHTPGHSPGHLALLFPDRRVLIAGDALTVQDGALRGPRPDVTPDLDRAWESVETLAEFDVETVHCFHGGTVTIDPGAIGTLAAER